MHSTVKLNNRFLNIFWVLTILNPSVSNAFSAFHPAEWEYKAYRTNINETEEEWANSLQEASEFWCEWVIVGWANRHREHYPSLCVIVSHLSYLMTHQYRAINYSFQTRDGLSSSRQAICPANSYRMPNDRERCICNPTFHEKRAADGSTQCTQYTVSIAGPGSTMALPSLAGPIAQEVSIIDSDGPVKDMAVSIEFINLKNNAKNTMGGTTMAGGKFSFIYTPPYFNEAEIALNATCAKCQNVASKTISVIPAEAEPQMCRR